MSTATQIDLSKFTMPTASQEWMHEPFVLGGWRYACNGFIAARVPAPDAVDETDSRKVFPGIVDVFKQPDTMAEPWPDTPAVRAVFDCYTCDGEGYVGRTKGKACAGAGETECPHCGQEMDCERCDGDGYVDDGQLCKTCKGKSRIEQDRYQMVGGLAVRGDFVALIRSLPGVWWAGNTDEKHIHFGFDGGSGVVMAYAGVGREDA